MSEQNVKISIEHVYKIFGPDPKSVIPQIEAGKDKTEILEETGHVVGISDVSLSIPAGSTFVVMGLSGSGKSTLIRHINRLIEPTAGRIVIDGDDVVQLNEEALRDLRRHKISMVFQRFALLPHKTVLGNVTYGLEISGVPKKEAKQRAEKQIELVGLGGFENNYPRQLSGGMQQRVGLARALATDAEILLMDEAFSALDPLIRNDMQDQLKELQQSLHKTVVFITHDLDEALRLGDYIAILKDGALRQVGTGEDILLHPADDYVARFVRDVNRGRVVTLSTIAEEPVSLQGGEVSEARLDSLLNGNAAAPAAVFLLDDAGRPNRAVAKSDLERNRGKGTAWWDELPEHPFEDAQPDCVIEEVLPQIGRSDYPLAVTDETGRLVGVVTRQRALDALARPSDIAAQEA